MPSFRTMNRRPKLPKDVEADVLYRNAWHCCVCRERCSPTIHHIDGNPSNNHHDNLAAICLRCHGEAHTKRDLSKNLTPELIRHHKRQWEAEVQAAIGKDMLPQTLHEVARWTYINHDALPAILKAFGVAYPEDQIHEFNSEGIVTPQGVPKEVIDPALNPDELVTIYDRIPYEFRSWLIDMYSEAIGSLILAARPVDFRELRTADQIRALVRPGTICFIIRGFFFRSDQPRPDRTQVRHVHTTACRTVIKFIVNTRFMFGTSAVTNSFVGHKDTAALLLVKSVGVEEGKTTIHCTPLAMGTGFLNRRTFWPGPGDG